MAIVHQDRTRVDCIDRHVSLLGFPLRAANGRIGQGGRARQIHYLNLLQLQLWIRDLYLVCFWPIAPPTHTHTHGFSLPQKHRYSDSKSSIQARYFYRYHISTDIIFLQISTYYQDPYVGEGMSFACSEACLLAYLYGPRTLRTRRVDLSLFAGCCKPKGGEILV